MTYLWIMTMRSLRKIIHKLARQSYKRLLICIVSILFFLWYVCLPDALFQDPTSTILLDRQGELLGAKIASDMQWRFPPNQEVPESFQLAITTFEDQRFYYHPGVDPIAILRALYQNISQQRVVSGASTLTMQVIRLARKGKSRTLGEKMIEMIWATRLEARHSKSEILSLYASHAPFGGNIVGIDAASWKYFGRPADQLSWAETATLAVLPNAPGLIHPGRNRDALKIKRDRLLERLVQRDIIDSTTCYLSQQEPLPGAPKTLPSTAPHLLERIHTQRRSSDGYLSTIHSTLDKTLQKRANEIVDRFYKALSKNGVHNIAAMIVEVETGSVISYIGNTNPVGKSDNGHAVDVITAPRSSGSILKPLLYASMLNDGELLPDRLVSDIPSFYQGYVPVNYDHTYSGTVPAHQALARSLNIPAVRMLHEYGISRFYDRLKDLGITTLHRSPGEYGLTLILGGAEVNLEDICTIYTNMSRTLRHFERNGYQYNPDEYRRLSYIVEAYPDSNKQAVLYPYGKLSASAIWLTFEAMLAVTRPQVDQYWQRFSSSHKIAWKTGTSFGARDAWAIGCTPAYVVGVWVGNANGEGRPGLTGIQAAAPVMFELFNILPLEDKWFSPPLRELVEVEVCVKSGYLATGRCPKKEILIPPKGQETLPCAYHRDIWLDSTKTYRVHSNCESPSNMVRESWFVLPPVEAHYYKPRHPDYRILPSYRTDCTLAIQQQVQNMELIYPRHAAKIYVPVDLNGKPSSTVFEITHRSPETAIYWHLDQTFVGSTREIHQMALNPSPGKHSITWVDQNGETLTQSFEIINKTVN